MTKRTIGTNRGELPQAAETSKNNNLDVLNIVENGCKWRSLPKEYGDWHVIYVRVNRWAKIAILKRHFCVYNSWDGVILSLSAGARPLAEAWPRQAIRFTF
ncbi:transposase [bacterium D16-76]|nr:transposase [bacterium D16-76]